MAKAASRRKARSSARIEAIESKVVDYAEELGRLLGTVRARVDRMGIERQKLVRQLSGVVKDAQALLSELGQEAADRVSRLTKGRRRRRKSTSTTRRKMTRRRGGSAKA